MTGSTNWWCWRWSQTILSMFGRMEWNPWYSTTIFKIPVTEPEEAASFSPCSLTTASVGDQTCWSFFGCSWTKKVSIVSCVPALPPPHIRNTYHMEGSIGPKINVKNMLFRHFFRFCHAIKYGGRSEWELWQLVRSPGRPWQAGV